MAGRGTDIKLDDEARAAGGLKIIGTERHESRRIDNQLRGRAGRQGDPGESQFYISLEDDLMRLFGSERLMRYVQRTWCAGRRADRAQDALKRHRESTEEDREQTTLVSVRTCLDYDQVMNDQREIIYDERRRVLNGESMRDVIYKMITDRVEAAVDTCISV